MKWLASLVCLSLSGSSAIASRCLPCQPTPTTRDQLLAEYAAGRYASVQASLAEATNLVALSREIATAPPSVSPKTVASLLLEVAEAQFNRVSQIGDVASSESAGRAIVEDACDLVRHIRGESEYQRQWFRSSLDLLEGDNRPLSMGSRSWFDRHLGHAASSVEAGELALAKAINREQPVDRFYFELQPIMAAITAPSTVSDRAQPVQRIRREELSRGQRLLRTAEAEMAKASEYASVRHEARIRLGFLATVDQWLRSLQSGGTPDVTHALELLSTTEAERDQDLAFLTHLFKGRAFELASRYREAASEYEAALKIRTAQSATIALAAVNYLLGREHQDIHPSDWLRNSTSNADDPWLRYFSGANRNWGADIAILRSMSR